MAEDYDLKYFEVSALNDKNVTDLFEDAMERSFEIFQKLLIENNGEVALDQNGFKKVGTLKISNDRSSHTKSILETEAE